MAVAFDNQTHTTVDAGTQPLDVTWDHAVAGANRLLVVCAAYSVSVGEAVSIQSLTRGAQSFTFLATVNNGNARNEMWYLIAPSTSGSSTIDALLDSVGENDTVNVVIGSVSFTGVDQTTPLSAVTSATGSSTAPSVGITGTSANNMLVDSLAIYANLTSPSMTADGSQTRRYSDLSASASQQEGGAASTLPSAASALTMSWTLSASKIWALQTVEVLEVSSVAVKPQRTLVGVGT